MQHSAACTRTLSASPAPLSLLLLILACSGPQVICGAAYSNTRSRLKRWVGNRNPNGPDLAVSPPTLPPSRPAPPRPRCAALRSRAAGWSSRLFPSARSPLTSQSLRAGVAAGPQQRGPGVGRLLLAPPARGPPRLRHRPVGLLPAPPPPPPAPAFAAAAAPASHAAAIRTRTSTRRAGTRRRRYRAGTRNAPVGSARA